MEKSDVHSLNKLADSLIAEDHSSKQIIKDMQDNVNARCENITLTNYSILMFVMFFIQLETVGRTNK